MTLRLAVCLIATWGVALLLTGCGGSASEGGTTDSAWTITEGEIRLEEDLFLTDSEDFYFGDVSDLAVRDDGRIYVVDREEHYVKALSPEGELLETIGTQGEGPGEFERPEQVDLARGDSLYVFDGSRDRMSVFASNHEFAYSFSMQGGHTPMILEDGSYLVVQSPSADQAVRDGKTPQVRAVSAGGALGDTLLGAPSYQPGIVMEEVDNGMMAFYFIPFAREPHFLLGPDERVHFAYGDSLGVFVFDRQGELRETISIPFDAVPVTDADLDRVLEGRDSHNRSIVEPEIPETKPAFTRFAMDDKGRYWFKRPKEDHERADWWIANPEAEWVSVVSLPSEVHLMAVRGGYAYGRATGEDGAPALVRYRIEETS